MEGNLLGAVIALCFQTRFGGIIVDEVKRVSGVMFANTVETERGQSLAKAALYAIFNHHCVGDTIGMAPPC